jgi:hypothetical protein
MEKYFAVLMSKEELLEFKGNLIWSNRDLYASINE